jgi:transcriptional regulator with XRE-family HTH domain
MQPAPPAQLELALRLRRLRAEQWPDSKLTQSALAGVLGGDESLSPATVASWENKNAPKLPPRERILAYAQFFATRRSIVPALQLTPLDSFTEEEQAAYEALREELLRLHADASGNAKADLPVAVRRRLSARTFLPGNPARSRIRPIRITPNCCPSVTSTPWWNFGAMSVWKTRPCASPISPLRMSSPMTFLGMW